MKKILFNIFIIVFLILFFSIESGCVFANARWINPQRIKIFIQPNHKNTELMKYAYKEWTKSTNGKINFVETTNSQGANITVHFVEKIPNTKDEIGRTNARWTIKGEMLRADVYIAAKHPTGIPLNEDIVYSAMVHEIGHAIGYFKHSSNRNSILYPAVRVEQIILPEDLKTINTIYNW